MASEKTIKVVKKRHRQSAVEGEMSLAKTANQLRREMVQTVSYWIDETREELAAQRRLSLQFRRTTLNSAVTETAPR